MIGSSAFQAGASSAHTVYDVFIRNIHINGKVDLASQFLKSLCQTFCLRNGSRKTVKNIAVLCIILLDSVYYKITGQFIRYKKPLIHIGFCFFAKLRAVFDVCTENVSCGNMGNSIFLSNFFCLSSLSGTRRTQHNNPHNHTLLIFQDKQAAIRRCPDLSLIT